MISEKAWHVPIALPRHLRPLYSLLPQQQNGRATGTEHVVLFASLRVGRNYVWADTVCDALHPSWKAMVQDKKPSLTEQHQVQRSL